MAVAAATRKGGLTRYFMGPRIGTGMIAIGIVLAAAAAVIVLALGRRAVPTSPPTAATQSVQVAYVVVAARDIAESTPLTPESVVVKAFPAAYAPAGAASTVEEVVGKFVTTRLVREQIILTTQLSATRRVGSLATGVPPGKLAVWMALPELPAQTGGLRAGDRIDLLFSVAVPAARVPSASNDPGAQPANALGAAPPAAAPAAEAGRALATQLTLQNIEVFAVGPAGAASTAAPAPAAPAAGGVAAPVQAAPAAAPAAAPDAKTAILLLDPQDALVAKFIKDNGGVVDLALRSREWADVATTEAVTIDSLVLRFGFREGTTGR